jgi:hypothetical protein
MKVTINIARNTAVVATMHFLSGTAQVNTAKVFRALLADYIKEFGISCLEDHAIEHDKYSDAADAIVSKYFK